MLKGGGGGGGRGLRARHNFFGPLFLELLDPPLCIVMQIKLLSLLSYFLGLLAALHLLSVTRSCITALTPALLIYRQSTYILVPERLETMTSWFHQAFNFIQRG